MNRGIFIIIKLEMYYVYMLRCQDNSIYTGITNDLEKRMNDHFTRNSRCAKYTLSHHAERLELAFSAGDRKTASRLEYAIKRLDKSSKEKVITDGRLPNAMLDDEDFASCSTLQPDAIGFLDKYR